MADIRFTPVQPDLFADPFGQSNAWGDYDRDGDLDLVVLFNNRPARLYRNNAGHFEDVAAEVGLKIDPGNSRSVAWGDVDNDGDLDLYIGYSGREGLANRLFLNQANLSLIHI